MASVVLMMRLECSNVGLNLTDCKCTNLECGRRGMCCECIRNHQSHGNYPSCLRYEPEKESNVNIAHQHSK